MNRVAFSVVLLALLGAASCGEEVVVGGDETARALRDIKEKASLIEAGLTPTPCGTDAMGAMETLSRLMYDHLHRTGWPAMADSGGPYPKDAKVRRAAAKAVCRILPLLQDAIACETEEIRHNAIATLGSIIAGGPYGEAYQPPEYASIRALFLRDLDRFGALVSDADPSVADYALEVVIHTAPRSATAWDLVRANLAGRYLITPERTADIVSGMAGDARAHFVPLLLASVLDDPPEDLDGRVTGIEAMEVAPSPALAVRMRDALAGDNQALLSAVLSAVATPHCVQFEEPVLAVLDSDERGWLRGRAASALGAMGAGAERATPALVRALASESRYLRCTALQALAALRMSSTLVVEAVLHTMEKNGSYDRSYVLYCIDALGACGGADPRARTRLKDLAGSHRMKVAERARAALATLDGG